LMNLEGKRREVWRKGEEKRKGEVGTVFRREVIN